MNKDEGDSSTSNHLAPIQQQKVSSTPNLRKHRMSDTHWDVNGDEGFDDPMIEDAGFTDQEGDWSRRGSRIVLDDDHEDEDRMTIQNEKIVHKGFFNDFQDDFDDKDIA
ncbi:unnamed protein product [Umbelopsis ramanniana]